MSTIDLMDYYKKQYVYILESMKKIKLVSNILKISEDTAFYYLNITNFDVNRVIIWNKRALNTSKL